VDIDYKLKGSIRMNLVGFGTIQLSETFIIRYLKGLKILRLKKMLFLKDGEISESGLKILDMYFL
ncbi:hypothetical protein, partial [Enterobacter cloacae]|uniref:hypothetical protein n=1 Tax=Enterobacter cloacae TaxID=550 RepID=UPI00398561C3